MREEKVSRDYKAGHRGCVDNNCRRFNSLAAAAQRRFGFQVSSFGQASSSQLGQGGGRCAWNSNRHFVDTAAHWLCRNLKRLTLKRLTALSALANSRFRNPDRIRAEASPLRTSSPDAMADRR